LKCLCSKPIRILRSISDLTWGRVPRNAAIDLLIFIPEIYFQLLYLHSKWSWSCSNYILNIVGAALFTSEMLRKLFYLLYIWNVVGAALFILTFEMLLKLFYLLYIWNVAGAALFIFTFEMLLKLFYLLYIWNVARAALFTFEMFLKLFYLLYIRNVAGAALFSFKIQRDLLYLIRYIYNIVYSFRLYQPLLAQKEQLPLHCKWM
jgi:hypothetical protein